MSAMTLILALLWLIYPFQQNLPLPFPRDTAKQIVENERVAVWDVNWPKGKPTPLHRHIYDVVGIDLADATVKVTDTNGQSRTSPLKTGGVVWLGKGAVHIEEGVSDNPRHAILIELKDAKVAPIENKTGLPLAFPREGSKKLLENERVTVWDYTWAPGKPTVMHFHDKDVVVVYLADGKLKSTTPDGKSVVNAISFGLTTFNAPNRSHSEEVVEGSARAVIVEFK